ncbi:MAG TPA: hypothetical protein VNR38_02865, partial [Ureibacillus sp.]|nr:hypothetical protein [Ureibacillus sp.]
VNIITLSGRHHKKEPLRQKGLRLVVRMGICSFLYILDLSAFPSKVNAKRMYKKCTFYSYASSRKI